MNHFITHAQAREMTRRFRENRDNVLQPEYKGRYLIPDAETFDRAAFDQVLAQEGCTALRIYYGMDEKLDVHAIIVGVDKEGRNIVPTTTATNEEGDPESGEGDGFTGFIETGVRCPPTCPPDEEENP
jgi:hypothetical protein